MPTRSWSLRRPLWSPGESCESPRAAHGLVGCAWTLYVWPLRSIVRRDTGETYEAFLMRLAQASGIATPTREDLARLDRKRPNKGSNDDWTHPHDPDARLTKMKNGRTHLAHKAEPTVDLKTGAVVAVTIQAADQGDTETIKKTLTTAAENLETVKPASEVVRELVADKGYYSNELLKDLRVLGIRTYISEPGARP